MGKLVPRAAGAVLPPKRRNGVVRGLVGVFVSVAVSGVAPSAGEGGAPVGEEVLVSPYPE